MQPATIAYTYDHDNNSGTAAVAVTMKRHKELPDSSVYRTDAHNSTVQTDLLQFSRAAAKRNGAYLGNEKTGVKRTKTYIVKDAENNDIKSNAIGSLDFSLPYGMTPAQKLDFLMELLGFGTSTEGKAALIEMITYLEN